MAYPKIAVIVGLDGLGKTPLINLMRREDPRVETHQLVPDPRKVDPLSLAAREVARWDSAPLAYEDRILIYDRFPWPDDWVYSLLRTDADADVWQGAPGPKHQRLERRMQTLGVRFVFLEPPSWKAYIRKMVENPDPLVRTVQLPLLRGRYTQWLERAQALNVRVMRVTARHFTSDDARTILNWISPDRNNYATGQVCPICETGMLFWHRNGLHCAECRHKVEDCCEGRAQ
jgi:hypothetical protein